MGVSAGIDIGSSTIKICVMDNGTISRIQMVPSSCDPQERSKKLLASIDESIPLVATGYGRDLVEAFRSVTTISEIKAHALGARYLFPTCQSVIDIGGQDVKVISLDSLGKMVRFEMNDRCSAGTGKFLEVMAEKMELSFSDFSKAALAGKPGVELSSQCTVFAESEVVGLLNRGCSRDDICRALHWSVVNRIKAMYSRIDAQGPIVLTGGCARNLALVEFLGEALASGVLTSEHSWFAGSIGCALIAAHQKH